MKRWFAIYTRSRHEKKVATWLAGKGLEHYLPLVTKMRRWKDRKVPVEFPLFPGYIFLRFDPDEDDEAETRLEVLRNDGVVRFAGCETLSEPLPSIPDKEVEAIRFVLEKKMQVDPYRYTYKLGQDVKIRSGPLEGLEGRIVQRLGVKRLVLQVHLIHRAIAVEISPEDVAP